MLKKAHVSADDWRVFDDAVARSEAWLSVLSPDERSSLMDMLARLTEQARALETKDTPTP